MENGKPYEAPNLTKRAQDYPRLAIHCAICQRQVDGYILGEGVLNIWCHGDGLRWGVEDPSGLAQYRTWPETPISVPPLIVFQMQAVAVASPTPKPQPLDLIDHADPR